MALCGSPYFGSRGITGEFLAPLLRRAHQICQLSLDSMHHTTADVIVRILAQHLPPASRAALLPAAAQLVEAANVALDTCRDEPHVAWRSSALSQLGTERIPPDEVRSNISDGSSFDSSMLSAYEAAAAGGAVQLDEMRCGKHEHVFCEQVLPQPGQESLWHGGLMGSLTMLHLDNLPMLGKGGAIQISALLAQAPHLQCLSLLGYDGPVDAVLSAAVQQCRQLQSISVGGCRLLTDAGLRSLCQLPPQLRSLSIHNCIMVSSGAILDVVLWHRVSMLSIDLWGTRAGGQELAGLLASGKFKRVNVGGSLASDASQREGLLRTVFNDLPMSCGTDLSTESPSLLLSQRVMFGPRFHNLLASTGLPVE